MHQTDDNSDAQWDTFYAATNAVWSGHPNGTLVAEMSDVRPGRVLDVGCGEGADAVWLAQRGWDVTALDVSQVALDRAAAHADSLGVRVSWLHSGFVEAALPAASFELVSAQYPVLERTPGNVAERALMDAVAVGGTLLIVHHVIPPEMQGNSHGFDPELYVGPANVAAVLDADWRVEVDETRPRHVATGGGAGHTEDVILLARRLR